MKHYVASETMRSVFME